MKNRSFDVGMISSFMRETKTGIKHERRYLHPRQGDAIETVEASRWMIVIYVMPTMNDMCIELAGVSKLAHGILSLIMSTDTKVHTTI